MARIHMDTWVEDAKCFGCFATPYLNGKMFDCAIWADVEAGEIGALVRKDGGGFLHDEETGEIVTAIVCGKVELAWPDKSLAK